MGGRWPRSLFGRGDEPDPRFTLANERTFLASIRTALGLLAAGVGLSVLERTVAPGETVWRITAAAWIAVAALLPLLALREWYRVELALRLNRPMPSSTPVALVLVFVIAAGGAALLVSEVLSW